MNNIESGIFIPDRNAFTNFFKNPAEFSAIILKKIRRREINLEEIQKNKRFFVRSLVGEKYSKNLSQGEIDIFVNEAIKVISDNKRLIDGSRAKLKEDALLAGFVDEGSYDNGGNKILTGDEVAYEAYLDGVTDNDE